VKRSALLLLAVAGLLPAAADTPKPPEVPYENAPYDGRYAFVRIRFDPSSWGPGNYAWGLDLKWNHDYARGESHLLKILAETTSIDVNPDGTNIFALDDPELFKYPVAYMCEVGFWTMSEAEVAGLRAYLLKGGFMIVDDFMGEHLYNFEQELGRALPGARLIPLDETDAIYDSFFRIDPEDFKVPVYRRTVEYLGVFEDNDRSKRLMMVVNYNNDIGEYWEWSDTGFVPIDLSNEAYKLGVNYTVYGITH